MCYLHLTTLYCCSANAHQMPSTTLMCSNVNAAQKKNHDVIQYFMYVESKRLQLLDTRCLILRGYGEGS